MLKIAVAVGAIVGGIAAVVVIVGLLLPKRHVAARALVLHRTSDEVFRLISEVQNAPSWRSGVQEVQLLQSKNGRGCYREQSANGTLSMEIVESDPPRRMATKIIDQGLPFGGTWVFDITPVTGGCRLAITERGEVYNPVFRFVSRFVMGYHRTIDNYLSDVARKFGERATLQESAAATP